MNINNFNLGKLLIFLFLSPYAFYLPCSNSAPISENFEVLESQPSKSSMKISRSPAVENIIAVEIDQKKQKSHPYHPERTSFNFEENKKSRSHFISHERQPNQLRKLANENPSTISTLNLKNIFLIIFLILTPFSLSYLISHHLFPLHPSEDEAENDNEVVEGKEDKKDPANKKAS